MRKLIFVLMAILIFTANAQAADVHFNLLGKPANSFFNQNFLHLAIGMAMVPLVHEAGHIINAEIQGTTLKYNGGGGFDVDKSNLTDGQIVRMARAGSLAQNLFGLGLKLSPWSDSAFANGYFLSSAFQITTYKLRRGDTGDFKTIDDHGGNGNFERNIYTAMALGQLWLTTDTYPDEDVTYPLIGFDGNF